jgi:pyrroloquinoline quinone biosynthesis protein D
MMSLSTRPCLSCKVRLRFDRQTARYLLLYPEAGLDLNASAAEIALLCTGEYRLIDIVQRLAGRHLHVSATEIECGVQRFLNALADRNLLQGRP